MSKLTKEDLKHIITSLEAVLRPAMQDMVKTEIGDINNRVKWHVREELREELLETELHRLVRKKVQGAVGIELAVKVKEAE